jgi:hypothetical protein
LRGFCELQVQGVLRSLYAGCYIVLLAVYPLVL